MLKYIVPYISRHDIPIMLKSSALGAVIAGIFGILHDQITFTISPEYFTKFKFSQFHYANFGLHDRIFVAEIGFLATWWVGFFCVWFLARRLVPGQPLNKAYRQMIFGFAIMGMFAITAAVLGFIYGLAIELPTSNVQWSRAFNSLNILEPSAFIRVAYIHNASYVGGFIGLVAALLLMRPDTSIKDEKQA